MMKRRREWARMGANCFAISSSSPPSAARTTQWNGKNPGILYPLRGSNIPKTFRSSRAHYAVRSAILTPYTYRCTIRIMKKRDLENALRRVGWTFLRHGKRHDIWTDGEREEAIPRHNEMNEKLARAILKRAERRN